MQHEDTAPSVNSLKQITSALLAATQAKLSGEVIKENLERWNGEAYEPCYNLPIPQPTKD